ncbi:CPBP family glutamic-type intramembrane protease [Basilea psittacipulmonis]|uniref:CAAX prenyl protease 2/Lysostaphin resistance protein A-like domain-containing protein n=1 Tax=Basilea psittacipulmonis DSM 24701 TaxID=1072685 RepID=A0A077DE88_9BURK|nr:CPBP family glutamic-type intramembrane protease [Basilea psittacipulmonis]AIL32476.1 hypothetical protein IX83_03390 [Basilea psittacipulmonis DSM 24701]
MSYKRTFLIELCDFWEFLKNPRTAIKRPLRNTGLFRLNMPISLLVKWLFFVLFVNIFIFAPVSFQAGERLVGSEYAMSPEMFQDVTILFYAIFLAPLIEEMVFRYSLRAPKIIWWYFPLIFLCLFLTKNKFILCLELILLTGALYFQEKKVNMARAKFVYKHYGIIVFSVIYLFAMLHVFNFSFTNFTTEKLPFLTMIVLPQFFAGLVLSFIRIRSGIVASIVLHVLNNATATAMILFFLSMQKELV